LTGIYLLWILWEGFQMHVEIHHSKICLMMSWRNFLNRRIVVWNQFLCKGLYSHIVVDWSLPESAVWDFNHNWDYSLGLLSELELQSRTIVINGIAMSDCSHKWDPSLGLQLQFWLQSQTAVISVITVWDCCLNRHCSLRLQSKLGLKSQTAVIDGITVCDCYLNRDCSLGHQF
jgi:hypothetical protein